MHQAFGHQIFLIHNFVLIADDRSLLATSASAQSQPNPFNAAAYHQHSFATNSLHILHELTILVKFRPLILSIWDVDYSLCVEDVTSRLYQTRCENQSSQDLLRLEVFAKLRSVEVQKCWEEKNHVSSFIHDPTSALGAADFAGENVLVLLGGGLVETEVLDTILER